MSVRPDGFMRSASETLRGEIAALGAWLREAAWPTWLRLGTDHEAGGFHEWLHEGACGAAYRRLRVAARQTIAFSDAHRAGVPGAAEAVALGIDYIERYAALPEGGYASRLSLDHRRLAAPIDTYDQAFVLLAFASATACLPREAMRARARALLGWMDQALAHPEGGYREGLPDTLPRRQNPHMHLLEALQAAAAAFGDELFRDRARMLMTLCLERMIDPETGALPEYFHPGWIPVREEGRFVVEPGHPCEWVWLMHEQAVLGLDDLRLAAASARLMVFVDRAARSPGGGLANLVGSDGTIVDGGSRLWQQAERLKAELLRADPDPARQIEAAQQLRRRLRADGTWDERLTESGAPVAEPAPASSLYHVSSAIVLAERKDVLF